MNFGKAKTVATRHSRALVAAIGFAISSGTVGVAANYISRFSVVESISVADNMRLDRVEALANSTAANQRAVNASLQGIRENQRRIHGDLRLLIHVRRTQSGGHIVMDDNDIP